MKTSGMEVLCDGCGAVIPVMHPTAIFVTLRGPTIRHKKLDCCNTTCLQMWASAHGNDGLAGAIPTRAGEPDDAPGTPQ